MIHLLSEIFLTAGAIATGLFIAWAAAWAFAIAYALIEGGLEPCEYCCGDPDTCGCEDRFRSEAERDNPQLFSR